MQQGLESAAEPLLDLSRQSQPGTVVPQRWLAVVGKKRSRTREAAGCTSRTVVTVQARVEGTNQELIRDKISRAANVKTLSFKGTEMVQTANMCIQQEVLKNLAEVPLDKWGSWALFSSDNLESRFEVGQKPAIAPPLRADWVRSCRNLVHGRFTGRMS